MDRILAPALLGARDNTELPELISRLPIVRVSWLIFAFRYLRTGGLGRGSKDKSLRLFSFGGLRHVLCFRCLPWRGWVASSWRVCVSARARYGPWPFQDTSRSYLAASSSGPGLHAAGNPLHHAPWHLAHSHRYV